MCNVGQTRSLKLVLFLVIRRKLGQVAKSLKFLYSNLNLPVSVGYILFLSVSCGNVESHEACSILSKCLKFMFDDYYFLELTFVRLCYVEHVSEAEVKWHTPRLYKVLV